MSGLRRIWIIVSLGMLPGILFTACETDPMSGLRNPASLSSTPPDSVLREVRSLMFSDQPKALTLAYGGLESAQESGQDALENQFLGEIACLFREEGDYEEADRYFDKALHLARERHDTVQMIQWLGEKGYSCLYAGQDSCAMNALTRALTLAQQVEGMSPEEQARLQGPAFIDLAQLYASLLSYDKAGQYLAEGQQLIDAFPHNPDQARLFEATAYRYLQEGTFEGHPDALRAAISFYRKSNNLYDSIGLKDPIPPNFLNMAIAWEHLAAGENPDPDLLDSAYHALNQFLGATESQQTAQYQLSGLHALAGLQQREGKWRQARQTNDRILRQAGESGSTLDSAYAFWALAEVYEALVQPDSVIYSLRQYEELASRVRDEQSQKALRFAEARFQTEKREMEFEESRALARQRWLLTLLIAVIVGLLLLAVTVYFYQRQRHQKTRMKQQAELNRRTIVDLIKEQAIESLNARLEGQEKERSRIARELHDHLGGTLAAARLNLEGMKGQLPDSSYKSYDSTMALLTNAYQETRQLSHDMMALPLKDLGLEASARALCQTISDSKKLQVTFDALIPSPVLFRTEQELHLYRILQELLQNVIKHARASRVHVQLTVADGELTLLVEDNGRGFPPNASPAGLGLSNIRDRVRNLNGTLDIDSQPGQGSTIIIQCPIDP